MCIFYFVYTLIYFYKIWKKILNNFKILYGKLLNECYKHYTNVEYVSMLMNWFTFSGLYATVLTLLYFGNYFTTEYKYFKFSCSTIRATSIFLYIFLFICLFVLYLNSSYVVEISLLMIATWIFGANVFFKCKSSVVYLQRRSYKNNIFVVFFSKLCRCFLFLLLFFFVNY